MSHFLTTHRWAVLVTVYAALLLAFYISVIPPFEAPDEASHFVYAHDLLETGALPVIQNYETAWRTGRVEAHQPPLYYALVALLIAPTERSDFEEYIVLNPFSTVGRVRVQNQNALLHPLHPSGDTGTAILLGRSLSAALALGTLWFVYGSASLVLKSRRAALAAMLFTASLPTFLYISASINNDNLATLLFSAGVFWLLWVRDRGRISVRESLLLGLILGAAALTKLNIVILFGLVYGWLVLEALRGRLRGRQVIGAMLVSGALSTALAGWWFLRNVQLYGDPLAVDATRAVWGRGNVPGGLEWFLFEARGVWDSFWLVLGHFNIRGDDWFYALTPLWVGVAALGVLWHFARKPKARPTIVLLLSVVAAVIAALIYATRQINVSQGRILFPMLPAFATLIVWGWWALFGRRGWMALFPLLLVALLTPLLYIRPALMPPIPTAEPPSDMIPLDAQAEDMELLGYRYRPQVLSSANSIVQMDVFIRGSHPENPTFFVKIIDPASGVPVGSIDTYPGMTYTSHLDPERIYRLRFRIRLEDARITGHESRRFDLLFGWRRFDPANFDEVVTIPWRDPAGNFIETLIAPGPILLNRDYEPPQADTVIEAQFGECLRLTGYSLSETVLAPGDTFTVTSHWQAACPPAHNWVLSVGLLDEAQTLVAQADGEIALLPVNLWVEGLQMPATRSLALPADAAPGEYTLYLVWYRREDGTRLPVSDAGSDPAAQLFRLPTTVAVE